MGRRSTSAPLPAVLPALAFAAGIAWAPAPSLRLALAAVAAVAIVGSRLAPGTRGAALLLAAAATGAGLGAADRLSSAERVRGWLPSEGGSLEGSFRGILLRAPERLASGEHRLVVAARPSPDPVPGVPPARLRFVVTPGSPEATGGVQALRAGSRIEVWARVGRPGAPGNPGEPDSERVLLGMGLDATGRIKSARLVRALPPDDRWAWRPADRALRSARERLDRALGGEGTPRVFVGAMLLGDRAALDPSSLAALRGSGLYHLVAISGLHTGFVAAFVTGILVALRIRGICAALAAGGALALFASITGGAPPVARAAGVACLGLVGRAIGRDGDPRNSLALVGALLLAVQPGWARNEGFLLSVGAVAAILTLAPAAARGIPLPPLLARGFAISAAAYVGTAPLLAASFGRLSPVGLVANLVAVPLAALVVVSGILCVVLADLPVLGPLAAGAARAGISALLATAEAACSLPFAHVRVPAPSPFVLAVYAGAVSILATSPVRRRRLRRLAAGALALALAALHLGPPPGSPRGAALHVLDVGQGQALAALTGDGTCALIDAGGSNGGRFDAGDRIVVPQLLREGCRRVDRLVLTHGHADHAGGIPSVIEGLDVGELFIPAGSARDDGVRRAVAAALDRGVAVRLAERGVEARAGAWRFRILHPARSDRSLPLNDRGIALLLESPEGGRVIVPGDLEARGERALLASGFLPHADVLAVGHHGARGSNGAEWLRRIGARVAVVSAGAGNRFGHPHPEALDRLRAGGTSVYRTDRDGQVVLRPDRSGWRVAVTARRNGTGRE